MKVLKCKKCNCLTEHKKVSSECFIEDKVERVFFTVISCGFVQLYRKTFYKCKKCDNIVKI